ncbi:MAG: atpC [Candidatus Saccharibacteria bacterium]|jgi:F0F1-type ATP synthase epsilon subunit|nr:atpC [Candidatus Saccharibacteria bacterium]
MAVDSGSGSTYQASQQAAKPAGKNRFQIKIFSPYQVYYQGEAISLSASNRTGPFDVLAGHINFFSLLTGGTVTLNTGFQKLEFQIGRGIIRVNKGDVTLFADV